MSDYRRNNRSEQRLPYRKLPKSIQVRCTEEEYEAIKKRAEKAGLSRSHYILQSCAYGKGIYVNCKDLIEGVSALEKELKRQGVNLNQAVMHINSTMIKHPDSVEALSVYLDQLIAQDTARAETLEDLRANQKLLTDLWQVVAQARLRLLNDNA